MTRSHQTKVALWCSSKVSVVVDRILDFDMHVIWRPLGWTRRYSHELAVGICMRSINKNSVCGSTPISPTDARLCPLLTVFANTAQSEHPLSTNAFQKKSLGALAIWYPSLPMFAHPLFTANAVMHWTMFSNKSCVKTVTLHHSGHGKLWLADQGSYCSMYPQK